MPTKRFYLLKQILQIKAADLFYRRTLSEQYFLQGSLLNKVKTKISNSSIQFLIFFNSIKLSFLDSSIFIVFQNKDVKALILLFKL